MVNTMYSEDDESREESYINYKLKYRELKKHLRALIYENECFQDELRKAQRNFVSVSRDKSFLLDRILKYEKPAGGTRSSDSDVTESSEEEEDYRGAQFNPQSFGPRKKITKRKRSEADLQNGASNQSSDSFHGYLPSKIAKPVPSKPSTMKPSSTKKPKKPPTSRKPSIKKERLESSHLSMQHMPKGYSHMNERQPGEDQLHMGRTTDFTDGVQKYEFASEGQMTREDIERHLEARRFSPELELNTTATVPAELFSQDPEQESDLDGSEICEFVQLDDDGTSADMILD